jgi:hypothetical protein
MRTRKLIATSLLKQEKPGSQQIDALPTHIVPLMFATAL